MKIEEKVRNILKIGKKTNTSISAIEDTFKVYQGRRIPMNVNPEVLTIQEIKSYPLINDPLANIGGMIVHPSGVPSPTSFRTLWAYTKGSPEIISIFSAIIEDIISDGYHLEGGRNNKIQAEKFLQENNFKEVLTAMMWDVLVTGNGYIYKSGVEREVKAIIDALPFNVEHKAQVAEDIIKETDINMKTKFVDVPSTTVTIKYDKFGTVHNYMQRVGMETKFFSPKNIIHYRYLKIDGKIYGFTPLTAITPELDTLNYIKDYARYFFEKGGVPNFMYILEDETPDSPTTESFKQLIREYSQNPMKWKSLVMTGKVNVQPIQQNNKDMEFRELAKYITQVLVMEWGIPASRLSDMLIDKGQRGATVSSEGYYRKISHQQDMIEDMVNSRLLKSFQVKLRFNRTYKQDEVREIQIEKVKTDIVEQRIGLGLWDLNAAADFLKIPDKIKAKQKELWKKIEELQLENPELFLPQKSSRLGGSQQLGQSQMNNQQMLSEGSEKREQNMDKQSANLKKK